MRMRRGDAVTAADDQGVREMKVESAASRGRHLLRTVVVLVTMFAAGLVASGVVAGAGPLAVLSDSTATENTTESAATSTESTGESTTTDAETPSDETTTEPTTESEPTTTEST